MDTTMHIDEKNVKECKGCARFPMARIVVSDKELGEWSCYHRIYLQAPEAPKTPIKAILQSIF